MMGPPHVETAKMAPIEMISAPVNEDESSTMNKNKTQRTRNQFVRVVLKIGHSLVEAQTKVLQNP